MLRTDLESPLFTGPSIIARPSSRFARLTCSGILVFTCTIFGFTQCYGQDVAEAARQEQARKENQQKKSKHVYTDDDLKRAQILTPEDRAQAEARKRQQPLPGQENSQDPIDALALPPDASLGDVARRYRRMRESLRLEQSAEFHLPFADEPVLATPKRAVIVSPEAPVLAAPKSPMFAAPTLPVPAAPKPPVLVSPKPPLLLHGVLPSIPTPPKIEQFQPPVKRSPFERPRVFLPAPPRAVLSHPLANHIAPPQLPAVGVTPSSPLATPASPAKPATPAHTARVMPSPWRAPRVAPVQPVAPFVHMTPSGPSTIPVAPSKPAAPAPLVGVMPSPAARVTPVETAAPVLRMTPSHPSMLYVTPSKPAAPGPDSLVMPSPTPSPRMGPTQPAAPVIRLTPSKPSVLGATPSQPLAPIVRIAPSRPPIMHVTPAKPVAPIAPVTSTKLNVVTVQPGDSLWKLAEQNLGNGLLWHDLLAVNTAIVDADRIVAGAQIFLPSLVSSVHAASRFTVRKGDTLSQIAQAQLGHASFWACIAQANPTIHDANLIFEGQLLHLPASCKP